MCLYIATPLILILKINFLFLQNSSRIPFTGIFGVTFLRSFNPLVFYMCKKKNYVLNDHNHIRRCNRTIDIFQRYSFK